MHDYSLSVRAGASSVDAADMSLPPDLRPTTPWPVVPPIAECAGAPMAFVAQVALKDFADLDWDGPRDGLLSFFVALGAEGDLIWQPGATAVVHEPMEGLEPRDHPGGESSEASVALRFSPELCVPFAATGPSLALEAIGLRFDDERAAEAYISLCHAVAARQGFPTPRDGGFAIWESDRFAGYAAPLPSDPIEDCIGLLGGAAAEATPKASAWRHLLQLVDFDDGEQTALYFCASLDPAGRLRLDQAQVSAHHS